MIAAWIALYLLIGVLITATLLALWDPSQRATFDRRDWLLLASYIPAWPLLLAVIVTDLIGWPGFRR